ncbi:hypothetical protein [Virgisporangium aurantiacum]|uniref:Uncharacterized protein n=1 Tax=Virgisporangium aurantiacum TaxID=175570 RepID=A0A8J3Z4V0_9ACTN|nr:hypothetical protein [Virgisporangium aurantiacum]GIJ57344.1 hypothetical protein Vau01_048600 [Virgisporangium aurantiacum]
MIFTLHTSAKRPAAAVVAGTTVSLAGGLRVEAAGGLALRCTPGGLIVDPEVGGALRAWAADGDQVVEQGWPADLAAYPARPTHAFTIGNETAESLEVWVEWVAVDTTVPAGGVLPAVWVGEPLRDSPDAWRHVCEINYETGVLQLWETPTCALVVGEPPLDTLGAWGEVPASLRPVDAGRRGSQRSCRAGRRRGIQMSGPGG